MTARTPAPSLQQLVEQHATCDRITAEAWARFDAAVNHWRARQRAGAGYEVVGLDRRATHELRRRA